jgi:hypothetical protein
MKEPYRADEHVVADTAVSSAVGLSVERRCAGLAAAAVHCRGRLLKLAEPIAAGSDVVLDQAPEPRTVLTVLETSIGRHCLSDVVVTTAAVTVAGRRGWGCVLGWDAEAAVASALLAASDSAQVDALTAEGLAREQAVRAERRAQTQTTRMAAS